MNIELKKFGTTLASRQAGKEAFAAFQPTLKDLSEVEDLITDFDGVVTFSPSWGDEFLTPLARIYGNRFKLKNTQNPSVKTTLEILGTTNNINFNIVNQIFVLAKKSFAKKIFGSNLHLSAKKISGLPQTQWAALAAARKNESDFSLSCALVKLYNEARTYFTKNVQPKLGQSAPD